MNKPRRSRLRTAAIGCLIMGSLAIAAVALIPGLRWRAQVLILHTTGQLPDIELEELLAFMMPGSDQSLPPTHRHTQPVRGDPEHPHIPGRRRERRDIVP